MTRSKLIRILAACVGLACLIELCSCACDCPVLSIDQNNAVGSFVSLPRILEGDNPPAEVGPALIRAKNGEQVIWVLRNPSSQDVTVTLDVVRREGDTADIKTQVFSDLGGEVKIEKNCGIGSLRALLQLNIVHPDSCVADSFNYFFKLYTATDTTNCQFPYDPELVVEGRP